MTTDPRVVFAAERTLLAWQRSALAFMGFGFVVERFGLFLQTIAHESLSTSCIQVACLERYFGGFRMNRARRKRSADQSSSTAIWRTVSNPVSRRTFQPLSRLNSQVYFFDVPFG